MIVYGEREDRVQTDSLLREILETSDPTEAAIRFGQLEAGVVDALCPDVDDWTPLIEALREAALSCCYDRLLGWTLPHQIAVRPAEGFAWYALYPRQYADAARRLLADIGGEPCVTVGLRSIGTTLSTAVRRVVGGPSFTVRPRGHPFDRKVHWTPALAQLASRAKWALVVDEGPGLSGSSFMAACDMLLQMGFPDERIVLFPAHEPDPASFQSERARVMWPRFRRYVEPFRRELHVPDDALDLSGGAWREYVEMDTEVVPFLERRKYLDVESGVLWKWAGLGQYGRGRLERAKRLAGFIPPAIDLSDGFLRTRWVEGSSAREVSADLLDSMSNYLVHLHREFRSAVPVDYEALAGMIRVNTGMDIDAAEPDTTRVALDGRMLPVEWLRTSDGWLKADALDHHDDHLFPGCQDIAWDIAGAAVEFGFDATLLAERYLRDVHDPGLLRRLPFHTLAYAAFRAGYAAMFGIDGRRYQTAAREFTPAS